MLWAHHHAVSPLVPRVSLLDVQQTASGRVMILDKDTPTIAVPVLTSVSVSPLMRSSK